MKNKQVKAFALILAGCLGLSALTGCGGISSSTGGSSKSSDGLMGSVKEETDTSNTENTDSSEAESPGDDMIGRYVSQGYENPSFGFVISLPDSYSLESRGGFTGVDQDVIEAANADTSYDTIRSYLALGSSQTVFEAVDETTYIYLDLQKASALDETQTWSDDEKKIAENSVTDEEAVKEYYGEDAEITDFQNNVEEIEFLGEKHYVGQYTFKQDGVPFYGVTIYMVSEEDDRYLLTININGTDLDAVDQADSYFSLYDRSGQSASETDTKEEVGEVSVGTISGNTYQNSYFGIQCKLEDPWEYQTEEEIDDANYASSNEKLHEILDAGQTAMDMLAQYDTEKSYQVVNTNITKSDEDISGTTEEEIESYLNALIEDQSIASELEEMGYENVSSSVVSGRFLGKETKMLKTTGEVNGISCYIRQTYIIKGSCVMTITVFSYVDDNCQEILDAFTSL